MLRELSEDVRVLVKDRLRDLRQVVRQHRHDHAGGTQPAIGEQPFPMRGFEGLLGHAASAFDDVMSFAETFAPRGGGGPVLGPQPLQSYFRVGQDSRLAGERAFRRDLYRLAKLVLEQKNLTDMRISESDFAAVHDALEKHNSAAIARLHAGAVGEDRVALVAGLSAALFVELVRHEPVRLPAAGHDDREQVELCLAAIAIACGLATLDMEGAAGAELMEIAMLAVDVRSDRILAALHGTDPVKGLSPLFAGLLAHLN